MGARGADSELGTLAPAELWDDAWRRLARAVRDPRHAFRNPVVATHCAARGVRARTVILRAAKPAAASLTLYTDRRSGKIAGLGAFPSVSWCFYDPRRRLQLRAETRAVVHIGDAVARAAWETQSDRARSLLRSDPAPGEPLSARAKLEIEAEPAELDAGFENFAVVECAVEEVDWLLLARAAHKRIRFVRGADGGWQGIEVAP